MKRYLIVGGGIAGLSLASALQKRDISFVLMDDPTTVKATEVAAGLVNPVVLKRLIPIWRAAAFTRAAAAFYRDLEQQLQISFYNPFSIGLLLRDPSAQNDWLQASDRSFLRDYLEPEIDFAPQAFPKPFGIGLTRNTARIQTPVLIQHFHNQLRKQGQLRVERFDFQALEPNTPTYQAERFHQIVFCEGHHLRDNPYFRYLPLRISKGEYLSASAERIELGHALKGRYFFIPEPDGSLAIGATYAHDDNCEVPSESARETLAGAFEETFGFPPEIRGQRAGFRPTVSDRRPLLGRHPLHPRLIVFNGLGTRGLLMAPLLAEALTEHLEDSQALAPAVSIARFRALYPRQKLQPPSDRSARKS